MGQWQLSDYMHVNMGKKDNIPSSNTHTDIVFDIGCFFKSKAKKNKQRNMKWAISERILDDPNTTIWCKKYCRTDGKMKKESQQIFKL